MKKYTLITGASSGIGLELARIAWREKRNLVLVARDEAGLKKIREELVDDSHPPAGGSNQKKSAVSSTQNKLDPLVKPEDDRLVVEVFAIDLSKPGAAQEVFDQCEEKNIFISELVNDAGFGDYGEFSKSDLAKQTAMIDLNIRTLTELTHQFLPNMLRKKTGRIMNLGSIASFLPGPMMSVYYATKHYVVAFSEGLAEELVGTGVTVTCLCPGPTRSNFETAAGTSKTRMFRGKNLPTARDVAEFGWYQMQQGERIAIHGRKNKLQYGFSKILPRKLVAKIVKRIQS